MNPVAIQSRKGRRLSAHRIRGAPTKSTELAEIETESRAVLAGHSVTALYELIPSEAAENSEGSPAEIAEIDVSDTADEVTEWVTVRVHYQPEGRSEEELLEVLFSEEASVFEASSGDFRFAVAVMGFGQIFRNSPYRGDVNYVWILSTAQNALGNNEGGRRSSFVEMVRQAEAITNSGSSASKDYGSWRDPHLREPRWLEGVAPTF